MAFQRNVGTHYKSDTASHTGRVEEIWRLTGSQFKKRASVENAVQKA